MITVSEAQLRAFGGHVQTTSKNITSQAQQMTQTLRRTLAEWAEGTESRQAFDAFEKRVQDRIDAMNLALAQMPGAINEVADNAVHIENQNRDGLT